MIKRVFIFGVIIAGMSSCGLFNTPAVATYSDVKHRPITGVVMNLPVVANLSVKPEKVQGVYQGTGTYDKASKTYVFYAEEAKNLAVQNALEKYGADVLLEPMFSVVTVDAKITVTVTGFVATYSGFRNATKDDAELLKIVGEKSVISGTKVVSQ